MHRALRISDITRRIVHQFSNYEEEHDQSSLYALALTNNNFSEAALDLLWKEATPRSLVQILPENTWKIEKRVMPEWDNNQWPWIVLNENFPLDISTDSFQHEDMVTVVRYLNIYIYA
jgi:hypothetical protein